MTVVRNAFRQQLLTAAAACRAVPAGFTNFLPDVPGAEATCHICCLPSKQMARIGNIAISPDAFAEWPYSLQQMLGWAFEPADEQQLLMLIDCGRRDALAWAQQSGLAELAASSLLLKSGALSGSSRSREAVVLPSSLELGSSRSSVSISTTAAQQQLH
jgi:hypothetical protein